MDKEKMNARELTEKELEMVSGGGIGDLMIDNSGHNVENIKQVSLTGSLINTIKDK